MFGLVEQDIGDVLGRRDLAPPLLGFRRVLIEGFLDRLTIEDDFEGRPFGYKIIRHDLGEGGRRRYRIIGEEIEPAEAEAIKEAASRVLRGESIRSIAFDFNDRGIKPVAGGRWAGSTLRRMLISPRIAGLREHNGEVVGEAVVASDHRPRHP